MRIEIDQSGKIGDTRIATVLAFSNHTSYAIYVSAVTKRRLIRKLRTQKNSRVFYFQLFALLLFLLLKDFLPETKMIYIDCEYEGWEGQIKGYLIDISQKIGVPIDADIIHFTHVGKHSPAHTKAIFCFRLKKGDREVTFEEISQFFLPKKKDRGPYR